MIESIWDILGIDPTTDKKKIKKAYAEKTKVYHPEDYPEEFKIVQEAYQWAMKYASKSVLDDEDLEIGINTNKSTDEVIEVNKKEENKSIEIDYSNLEEEDFKIKDNRKEKTNKKSETNSSNNKKYKRRRNL